MALTTHVTDRFGSSSQFLIGLTNHDDEDGTSVNTTRLAKAAEAAEGQFPVYAQVSYDDTDAAHIEAGVLGVIAYLRMWSSKQGAATSELESFRDSLRAIARISSRKRVDPQTKSVLTPSTPDTTGGDVRPIFDTEQFDDVMPDSPEESN